MTDLESLVRSCFDDTSDESARMALADALDAEGAAESIGQSLRSPGRFVRSTDSRSPVLILSWLSVPPLETFAMTFVIDGNSPSEWLDGHPRPLMNEGPKEKILQIFNHKYVIEFVRRLA